MNNEGITPNAKRLLYAGFMAILAAGVGFSVRGGVLGQWAEQFGFTMSELGTITGGGLTGFGIVIILSSFIADRIGYGKLLVSAFVLHAISAVLTLAAPAFFASGGKSAAYWCLYSAMFIFAVGNGVCEAVVNPLTATLFPKEKTKYLNILHAGWPAGLVLGGLASAFMAASTNEAGEVIAKAVDWKIQMSLFLIPVLIYGVMLLGQKFPRSEASLAGVTPLQMFKYCLTPLMLVLLLLHAMVGYVELGTDSWIGKITGSIMASPQKGLMLFVYTSLLMFALRCALANTGWPWIILFLVLAGLAHAADMTRRWSRQAARDCSIASPLTKVGDSLSPFSLPSPRHLSPPACWARCCICSCICSILCCARSWVRFPSSISCFLMEAPVAAVVAVSTPQPASALIATRTITHLMSSPPSLALNLT